MAESGWNQRRRLTYFYIVVVLTQRGPGKSTKLLPLGVYFTGFSKMSSDLEGA
jgi:ABC-type sugar transport system permease subunit